MEFLAVLGVFLILGNPNSLHNAGQVVFGKGVLLSNLGNGRNTVSRVLFRKKERTEFCRKLGEFCVKLGEFTLAQK